jgi:hypothetical protein
MIINIRTKDNLNDLLAAEQSGNWVVSTEKEYEPAALGNTKVKVYSWDGSVVLTGDYDPSRSVRTAEGRLIIGIANGRLVRSEVNWPWQASRIYTRGADVQTHGVHRVGIVREIDVLAPTSKSIGDYFDGLTKELIKEGIEKVVFKGGGTIPIPDSFKEFCKKNGIKIEILDEGELDKRYPIANNDPEEPGYFPEEKTKG